MNRKICVVTGTRAEYGLMTLLLREIHSDPRLTLQLVVTGMHLAPEFGATYREIESDGFAIDRKVEILLSSDSGIGVTKAVGLGLLSFAEAFPSLAPDLLVLTGDRFEMLAAASAAHILRIPIAHIGGGDVTEGAFDDAIRHAITKMAALHFVTNDMSRRRVIRMGEDPRRVFDVGSPGLDCLAKMSFLSREELARDLGFSFQERNVLVTYHPETVSDRPVTESFGEVLAALAALGPNVGLIFSRANADTAGRAINDMIDAFVEAQPTAKVFPSLGHRRYLSLVRQVDAVVGNSSSGVYEVPSLGKPTVNIGDRQAGRLLALSVISCTCKRDAIGAAIRKAFMLDCKNMVNPYGKQGDTSRRIKDVLAEVSSADLSSKSFYDGPH